MFKKTISFLVFTVLFCSQTNGMAQVSGYGVSAGINMTQINVQGREVSTRALFSPVLGLVAHGRLNNAFGLLSETSFSFAGAAITDSIVNGKQGLSENTISFMHLSYLIAPTFAITENVFLLAGLELGFSVPTPGNSTDSDENVIHRDLSKNRNAFFTGWVLGAGYAYHKFRVDLRYSSAFNDIADLQGNGDGITSATANAFGIHVVYIFNDAIKR